MSAPVIVSQFKLDSIRCMMPLVSQKWFDILVALNGSTVSALVLLSIQRRYRVAVCFTGKVCRMRTRGRGSTNKGRFPLAQLPGRSIGRNLFFPFFSRDSEIMQREFR